MFTKHKKTDIIIILTLTSVSKQVLPDYMVGERINMEKMLEVREYLEKIEEKIKVCKDEKTEKSQK